MSSDDSKPPQSDPIVDLAQMPLLAGVTTATLLEMARHAIRREYAGGDAIIRQEESGASLFLLSHGWVQILMDGRASQNLGEIVLHNLGPGQVFGEIAVLDQGPRSATAVALEPVTCYELRHETVEHLLATSPSFCRAMLQLLAERVRQADERVAREARDPLTNLPNRGMLSEYYGRVAARLRRQGGEMALALLDVDHLKQINDGSGHAAGDQALRSVASALRTTLRGMDLAVRWGGDEFAVLLPGSSPDGAHVVIDRVRASLASLTEDAEPVTVSYGVAATRNQRDDPVPTLEMLLGEADRALYAEKERRRRPVV